LGHHVKLQTVDGHRLGAYRADPDGQAIGGIVVLQEIFGVNKHIRSICDRLASEGYVAVAPALFDRITPGFESGYSNDEVTKARSFISKVDWDAMLLDVEAAAKAMSKSQPTSVIGFCLGGSVAYLAAIRQRGFAASVCFYGGKIVAYADEAPLCPTQMHFGEQDHGIPLIDVETIRGERSDCDVHLYPAGHGFNCDERASFHPESAALAWERTLTFIKSSTT
jgi:carboxymethylenebutenolidase